MLESVEGCFQFLAISGSGEDTVKPYPLVEDVVEPAVRVREKGTGQYAVETLELAGGSPAPGAGSPPEKEGTSLSKLI